LQIFVARAFFWQRESILLTPNSQNAQEAVKTKTTAILIKKNVPESLCRFVSAAAFFRHFTEGSSFDDEPE